MPKPAELQKTTKVLSAAICEALSESGGAISEIVMIARREMLVSGAGNLVTFLDEALSDQQRAKEVGRLLSTEMQVQGYKIVGDSVDLLRQMREFLRGEGK